MYSHKMSFKDSEKNNSDYASDNIDGLSIKINKRPSSNVRLPTHGNQTRSKFVIKKILNDCFN